MNINFEIDRSGRQAVIRTESLLADKEDKETKTNIACTYSKMAMLADKYNNHPRGCIGVTFTVA